jgi:hypothetical protein
MKNQSYELQSRNRKSFFLMFVARLAITGPRRSSAVSAKGRSLFRPKPAGVPRKITLTFNAMKSLPVNPAVSLRTLTCLIAGAIASLSLVSATPARAAAAFSYSLTTQNDPVAPGHVLEFDATVTNLSATSQSLVLDFIVPKYTTYGGLGEGTPRSYSFGSVAPGASETAKLLFTVVGNPIPPDGTVIKLKVTDTARGVSVSRTAIVQSIQALNLQLSSEQGTVPLGGKFTYTLATANLSDSSLSGTTLRATVPKGASFVSADGGGVLSGKTVTWSLGTLPVGANVQVHATFQASSSANTPVGPLDAIVSDSAGDIARASDTRVVYAAPVFKYRLTATPDPVAPGHVLEYDATVTNLTAGDQFVTLDFTVPEFTTYGGLGAGTPRSYSFGSVAPGASETAKLFFNVLASGPTPPDGASITLYPLDLARGASVSRTVVVQSGAR